MKSFSWKNSVYSAVLFFGTLSVLSIGYSALSGWLTLGDKVGTGSGLTAGSWNKIVDGVIELDGRTAGMTSSGGSIGIGNTNPFYKLDVNGGIGSKVQTDVGNSITIGNANANWNLYVLPSGDANSKGFIVEQCPIPGSCTRRFNIDQNGNIGIGTSTPKAKLEVAGDFIRTIARTQGYNQSDATDNGAIVTRVLIFTKKQADTGIRITYSDGRRVSGTGTNAGRWEAKFNGASCASPGPINWDMYSWPATDDIHRVDTTIGTCFGLTSGTYTIQIYVAPIAGYNAASDLHTWWNGIWSLEAEEVR